MTTIVCYTGGTCGDLITALIDSTDSVITNGSVKLSNNRSFLKKPHQFNSDIEKDKWLQDIQSLYKSVPSHDLQYHIQRRHNFIGISVTDKSAALWAAQRFNRLHSEKVWSQVQNFCGSDSIEQYCQAILDSSKKMQFFTKRTIKLERILSGYAVDDLIQLGEPVTDKSFYQSWLTNQNK
jgi:hypothetical protein